MLEHGYDQGLAVRQFMLSAKMCDVQSKVDLAGHERVTIGQVALPG